MLLTTFNSDFTSSKVPNSPFGDKTFIFDTIEVTPKILLERLRDDFVLNRHYKFNKNYRARRTIRDLKKGLKPKIEYVILDLDAIKTKYSENQIIKFFKEKDYFVGLIPSRSYNGVDNFNLKGFVLANGINNKASIKAVLEEINQGIYNYTKVDISALVESSYQAPTYSKGITLYQEGDYIPTFNRKEEVKEHINIKLDKNHNKVIDACLDEFRLRGFQLTKITKNDTLMIFSHPSEKTSNGYFVFINNPFYMNHYNAEKSFSIFSALKNNKHAKDYFDKLNEAKRIIEFGGIGASDETLTLNTRYLGLNTETKVLVSKWLNSKGLLKIKSSMGTGKSNIIDYSISEANKKGLRTLLITNRISVAKDFSKKYDIKIYSDGNYNHGDNLIVQYDSLWKYSLKHFDVVILDEFVSLMLHTRNTLSDYGNLNKTKLMYAMRSKTCLIADAFLIGIEDKFIETIPKYFINNVYRENLNVYEYPNIDSIVHKIVNTTLEDKDKHKVSISCTSKSTAEAITELCEQKGLKTMLLSSDTLDMDKETLYKIFELDNHDYWDVLIYTPTLTVGVSNLNNTNNHFHIDESNSADVVSSLQMIRRSRKAKNIHYMVAKRNRFLETKIDTLNKEININIQKYYKKNTSILISVDEYGDFKLSDTGKFINKIEIMYNKLEINHKHSFELLLKHQIKKQIILMPSTNPCIDIREIKKALREKRFFLMKEVLDNLEPIEYEENVLDEYKERNYIVSDKDKMLKLLSDVRKSTKDKTPIKIVREIARLEINKKFKFISELKRLKLYLTKNETEVKDLLGFIVSENTVNKGQIMYFKYIMALKKHSIVLKNKITTVEINKVNEKLGFGDFKTFLKKVGYRKRGGVFYLEDNSIKYYKYMK